MTFDDYNYDAFNNFIYAIRKDGKGAVLT